MSFEEKLIAMLGDIDNFLKEDVPCPEIPGEENSVLEDCSLTEVELLDKDLDDFITSVLQVLEGEPDVLQSYLLSENQHLSLSSGSNYAGSPWCLNIVQVDHNYSLPLDMPVMESVKSDMAEDTSIELGACMGVEDTSIALEHSSSFFTAVAMDASPWLVPGVIVQTEEQPVNELFQQSSAQDGHHREIGVYSRENRVGACMAQNCELEKVQLLRKQNMPLLEELEGPQTLVTLPATRTATEKTCAVNMVLSVNLTFASSLFLLQSEETERELRVLSQQICEFPNLAAPDERETTALEGFSPEPEDPSLLAILGQLQEEQQSLPNPNPRCSFSSNSSSDLLEAAGFERAPPQPWE